MILERPSSIAVIGAGVAGLVAAYRLLQQGHSVRIFEAGPQPGGLLRTFEIGDERLESFYHHLFTSDGAAIRLLDELGLLKTINWRTTRMGIFYNDHVYPFTSPWDLMRFRPLLGIRDRIRLGVVALQLRRNQMAKASTKSVPSSGCASTPGAAWQTSSGSRCCAESSVIWPIRCRWRGCGIAFACASRLAACSRGERCLATSVGRSASGSTLSCG